MTYDVVVVGAGHAGCEAAAAAARVLGGEAGGRVALVTLRCEHVGRLSCNPAIGGLAKGHLVREIDALGGIMGRVADATCIQFRRLNTRKGLAVQSSRAQVDIDAYPKRMAHVLAQIPSLDVIEGEVAGVEVDDVGVQAVTLADGRRLKTNRVVLTTGTFLSAVMHCGDKQTVGGRVGDAAATTLSESLSGLGIRLGRLKTGTVPRLLASSIDWGRTEAQTDVVPDGRFSFSEVDVRLPQITCHLAYTNERTHAIIRSGLDRSPLFTGVIKGVGPRYCPSIEDKVVRFPDRDRHLLFLEPEGLNTDRVYLNGLSTSLPSDVQDDMVHSITGLETAVILQHGYAVEYDFADPTDLGHDLQHKQVKGMFFAGQVNGTSGYEEAAAQGLIAGLSAALGEPFRVGRDEGYIGVLIDDLVSRGVGGEPYRMFTSRAEHRLLLREDNADRRLMARGWELGLQDAETFAAFQRRCAEIEIGKAALAHEVRPDGPSRERFTAAGIPLRKACNAEELLRRPEVDWAMLGQVVHLPQISAEAAEQVTIDVKYAGYVQRAQRRANQARKLV